MVRSTEHKPPASRRSRATSLLRMERVQELARAEARDHARSELVLDGLD